MIDGPDTGPMQTTKRFHLRIVKPQFNTYPFDHKPRSSPQRVLIFSLCSRWIHFVMTFLYLFYRYYSISTLNLLRPHNNFGMSRTDDYDMHRFPRYQRACCDLGAKSCPSSRPTLRIPNLSLVFSQGSKCTSSRSSMDAFSAILLDDQVNT